MYKTYKKCRRKQEKIAVMNVALSFCVNLAVETLILYKLLVKGAIFVYFQKLNGVFASVEFQK